MTSKYGMVTGLLKSVTWVAFGQGGDIMTQIQTRVETQLATKWSSSFFSKYSDFYSEYGFYDDDAAWNGQTATIIGFEFKVMENHGKARFFGQVLAWTPWVAAFLAAVFAAISSIYKDKELIFDITQAIITALSVFIVKIASAYQGEAKDALYACINEVFIQNQKHAPEPLKYFNNQPDGRLFHDNPAQYVNGNVAKEEVFRQQLQLK